MAKLINLQGKYVRVENGRTKDASRRAGERDSSLHSDVLYCNRKISGSFNMPQTSPWGIFLGEMFN